MLFAGKGDIMIEKQLRKYIIPNVLAMAGTSCYAYR